jgi:CubicO group peptidase (beta-lactamase class C family)
MAVAGVVAGLIAAALPCGAQAAGRHSVSATAGDVTAARAIDMTPVKPETVGFSPERLENLHRLIQGEIDQKQLAGAITILARHGKVVDYHVYGQRDLASGAAMTKDTIFRDYSMTKPVTGVAMMILCMKRASGCRRSRSRSMCRSSRT